MSLQRLAAGCVLAGFDGHEPPDWLRRALADGLGGVCLFAGNVRDDAQVAALTAALRAERPETLVAVDEEGGDVTRLEWERGSSYPGNLALGAVDDAGLTGRVAAAIASDLARAGVSANLAPVADVNSNPRNPVIGVRSFGSDPELVARHVAAFVGGTQSAGVAACAKHFPGHGDTAQDSHLELPVARPSLEPFRAAIAAGVRCVMTGHLLVPELDDRPATLSRRIVGDLLRGELGFDGLVVGDALDMRALAAPVGELAADALAAGVDALILGNYSGERAVGEVVDAVVAAVRAGRLAEERVAEAAARVAGLSRPPAPISADRSVGVEGARRAVQGSARVGPDPLVVELVTAANIAAGEHEHRLLPDARRIRLREGDPPPELEGEVVLVLRDAARHPWQRDLAARLPHAVVVETGVPGAPADVVTYGAGRVNLEVAAERLVQ
ncbi:MAG TPA: glycoside hydrolase family 3 N-terminal domain-containing protein [Gaiellaceae bacterium]